MYEDKRNSRNVDFLFEMGSIRYISRMWSRFSGVEFANLADHHFHVFWIAMVIAAQEGGDTGKIAKMVMVHDIAESRTGDVDYLARQYVERNEKLGITDMLAGTAVAKEFLELWHEYEERSSLEAKIVKDADNLNVDFELTEQAARGHNLKELWKHREAVAAKKLYTETAKALYQEVITANPHGWHMHGRNRISAGDWQDTQETATGQPR